jgi:hypothetical protein
MFVLVIGLHQHDFYLSRVWNSVYDLAQDAPCGAQCALSAPVKNSGHSRPDVGSICVGLGLRAEAELDWSDCPKVMQFGWN